MNAATAERFDEIARDVGRELALQPEPDRVALLGRFLQVAAEESAAAIAHRDQTQAA